MFDKPHVYGLSYNGKLSYIGIHNGSNKYYFSGGVIPRKLGKNKFIKGVICYCEESELQEKEVYYISIYSPRFNLTTGGERVSAGTKHSIETVEKRKKSFLKNKKHLSEISKRFSEMNKIFNARQIGVVRKDDGKFFKSIREASRECCIDSSYLSKHLKGKYKSAKGMTFEYI